VLSPTELIEKLAALVPPPRLNLIRYHGVLAPAAADRAQIVPGPRPEVDVDGGQAGEVPRHRHRVEWARLLARVFQVDVLECDACGGPMRVIAALTVPDAIHRYLDHVGLPSRAPPISPARQRRLGFDEAA